MTVHLSDDRERLVLSVMRAGKFSSAEEVIDEGLRLVGRHYAEGAAMEAATDDSRADESQDRNAQQLDNLKRLGRTLDAMPTSAIADGLTNRDHDRILYGR